MTERERRIRELLPLVRRIARRVQSVIPHAPLDDLIGDGSIGLIRSVDAYDPSYGVALEGYARKVIVGTMLNGLRRMDPVSERVRRCVRRADDARYDMAQERGALPTMNEMERRTNGLRRARTTLFRHTMLSLDAPLFCDEGVLVDSEADPARHILRGARAHELREAIALLTERQRRVVTMHYYQHLSLHAIGSHLNVTPQRVSQLHARALLLLRAALPAS